jgi:multidrug efflux pump subunit AcrA (membrane-fusion protein)
MHTKARITVPEYPGRDFPATVEASTQAVDAASGTTRMLLFVDNSGGELMTGAFANIYLDLAGQGTVINIPASALIFDRNGLRVATVGADSHVVLRTVTIARDLGNEIEIASGLEPDDRVIATPPDGIASGDEVRVAGTPMADSVVNKASATRRPPG